MDKKTSSRIFSPQHGGGDDDTDEDEDLVLDPPPACTLFSVDSPGFNIITDLPLCVAALNGLVFQNIPHFSEPLYAEGIRASNSILWHAVTTVKCAQNAAGDWAWEKTDEFMGGNILGQGLLPIPFPAQEEELGADLVVTI